MTVNKNNSNKKSATQAKPSQNGQKSADDLELEELELAEIQTIFQEIEVAVHPEEVPETQESLLREDEDPPNTSKGKG